MSQIETNCQTTVCVLASLGFGCTTDTGCLPAPLETNVLNTLTMGKNETAYMSKWGEKKLKALKIQHWLIL